MKKFLLLMIALLLVGLAGCKDPKGNSSTGSTESFIAAANTEYSSKTDNTENTSTTEGQELPVNVEQGMKTTYLNQYAAGENFTVDNLSIEYYGCYDGVHIGFIHGISDYPTVLMEEVIGGLTFRYSSGQKLLAYRNGELMNLKDAYEAGRLSYEALQQLLEYYKTVKPYLFEE